MRRTVTKLWSLFSPELFAQMRNEKLIRLQYHPEFPELTIVNYTEKAQYDGVWNKVTLQCRGLIYDAKTQEVLARPFKKFFNHGQAGAEVIHLDEEVLVTDKLDGSLGIQYRRPDGKWAIATRGSFASEQAIKGTEMLQRYIEDGYEPYEWATELYEIIYPENRIVLDYGQEEKLVWLGAVDLLTGVNIVADPLTWPGPVRQKMPAKTMAEALALKPRPNAEGVVVHALEGDRRVKIKQEDYILLHRIITGLNARSVWEVLKDPDKDLIELYSAVPDEFHHWISDVAQVLTDLHEARYQQINQEYLNVMEEVRNTRTDEPARKTFALAAQRVAPKDTKYMFALLDSRSIDELLWNEVKPEAGWSPVQERGEDVA